MDRFIVREPRADYPRGDNQLMPFAPDDGGMITIDKMYLGNGLSAEVVMPRPTRPGFMGVTHVNAPYASPANKHQPQASMMSGIDPRYLAMYNDSNAAFIAGQRHQMEMERRPNPMTNMNRQCQRQMEMERSPNPMINMARQGQIHQLDMERPSTMPNMIPANHYVTDYRNNYSQNHTTASKGQAEFSHQPMASSSPYPNSPMPPMKRKITNGNDSQGTASLSNNAMARTGSGPISSNVSLVTRHPTPNADVLKNELQNQSAPLTRIDKLKALQKSGPRAFSGPLEKVVKWHKALHDIGVFVYYEIVAKCVNVRPGEGCAKNLVVRDDNGPAMQVVYYEIDFMLPELKVPCTVRVIGRMQPGTCRLQAFNVRLATSDDVATLPRRAAVAAHHVAKLCKEYGLNSV